ncbi:unnamed protein product [Withania somnifera]
MATDKVAEHGGDDHRKHHPIKTNIEKTMIEEAEQAELSQLCQVHCKGIPASHGSDQKKATVEACEFEDDGSGQLTEKCQTMYQQADHFRCHK